MLSVETKVSTGTGFIRINYISDKSWEAEGSLPSRAPGWSSGILPSHIRGDDRNGVFQTLDMTAPL